MSLITAAVNVDDNMIMQMIEEKINNQVRAKTMYMTLEDIAREVGFGKTAIREHITSDTRMKVLERRASENGKAVWLREHAEKAIQEIIDEKW